VRRQCKFSTQPYGPEGRVKFRAVSIAPPERETSFEGHSKPVSFAPSLSVDPFQSTSLAPPQHSIQPAASLNTLLLQPKNIPQPNHSSRTRLLVSLLTPSQRFEEPALVGQPPVVPRTWM